MSEQALGAAEPTNPFVVADKEPSIVDTILDLDALLSADVRRAEKTARFSIRPDLEARLDELQGELEGLTDETGRPILEPDAAVGTGGTRTAEVVAQEWREVQAEYAASMRSVRMRQIPDEDWAAFETKWRAEIKSEDPKPQAFWDELIVATAHTPAIPADKVKAMRKQLGRPAMDELGLVAWRVNTSSGVDVPKSRLVSAVLRPRVPARS
jgi:hypothetical protein